MPEYRQIANLRGPEGPEGPQGTTEPRGTLSASTDIEDLDWGLWAVQSTQVAEGIGLPGPRASVGYLEKIKLTDDRYSYRYTTLDRGDDDERHAIWTRGMDTDGNLLPDWKRIYPDTGTPGTSAPAAIRSLAAQDGWLAVYDPTDTEGMTISSNGFAVSIRDSLGNLPPLGASGSPRRLDEGAFGQLSALGRTTASNFLSVDFDGEMDEQLAIVTLIQKDDPHSGFGEFVFDGVDYDHRNAFLVNSDGEASVFDGLSISGHPLSSGTHVVACVFDGAETTSVIDGQLNHYGSNRQNQMLPTGLTVGARYDGTQPWRGDIGPVLIYKGRPPQEVLNRMTALLHSLSGAPRAQSTFSPGTRIFSVDGEGNETFRVGDPDAFGRSTAQSLMKMMTCYTARQTLTSNSDLDETVEIHEDDVNNNIYRAGDIISYRDLMYAAALPSSNATPATIARHVGQILLDEDSGSSDLSPRERFVVEMEQVADDLGYEGISFRYPWSQGLMTPRQLVDLMRRISEDDALREIFGARERELTFDGPEVRTTTVTHTIEANAPHHVPYVAGKTGSGFGVGHVVVAWEAPDGTEHITAVMDTDQDVSALRYEELWKAQTAVLHGAGSVQQVPAGVGDTERTTQVRDITGLVGALDGTVSILRNGSTVTITVDRARLPEGLNLQGVLPSGLRPRVRTAGLLTAGDDSGSDIVPIRVFPGGTLRVYGNSEDDELSGVLTYSVDASRFVSSPFPGIPWGVNDGPG